VITRYARRNNYYHVVPIVCQPLPSLLTSKQSLNQRPTDSGFEAGAIDFDVDDDECDSENEEQGESTAIRVGPDSTRWQHCKKSPQLLLVELLAFLLATDTKSHVAASLLVAKDSMQFVYCKNTPFTEEENKYIHALFNYAFQTDRDFADRHEKCLALVLDNCQNTIRARVGKLSGRVKELQSTANRGIHSERCLPRQVVQKLKARLDIDAEQSLQDWLLTWCDYLSNHQNFEDPEFMRYAISSSYIVGLPSEVHLILEKRLLRKIRQLGDYVGAVINLLHAVKRLPPDRLRSVVLQEVLAPPPYIIIV
jgi:hypothetical protein